MDHAQNTVLVLRSGPFLLAEPLLHVQEIYLHELAEQLRQEGYDHILAHSGEEALEQRRPASKWSVPTNSLGSFRGSILPAEDHRHHAEMTLRGNSRPVKPIDFNQFVDTVYRSHRYWLLQNVPPIEELGESL